MALYKYSTHLQRSNQEEFDRVYEPGNRSSWSGIYRCVACGHEIVHTTDKPLAPQNHYQHRPGQGRIQWKLVVTDYTPSS
jgi:hypothetical protein